MNSKSLSLAIDQLFDSSVDADLSLFESGALLHPTWATPVVALARVAEDQQDWDSAFELWSQARLLVPQSDEVKNGIARAAINLMRSSLPGKLSSVSIAATGEVEFTKPVSSNDFDGEEDFQTRDAALDDSANVSESADDSGNPESSEDQTNPSPLVQPFDFDLTDYDVETPAQDSTESDAQSPLVTPAETADESISDFQETTEVTPSSSDDALDELDQLIGRLEGARIVPREDAETIPKPNLENDIGNIASETLATIYLDQEQFDEAAAVFDRLAEQHPDRADEFTALASEARAKVSN